MELELSLLSQVRPHNRRYFQLSPIQLLTGDISGLNFKWLFISRNFQSVIVSVQAEY